VINLKYNVKFYFWKRAVKGLVEKHSSYRFIHVIMPAVGWALYLGLDRSKVENYLKKVFNHRKKSNLAVVDVIKEEESKLC